ncbi:MAG: cytochrome c3 family protein [Croceibacterium sp.]
MTFRIRSVDTTASGREIVREREVAGDELTIGRAADNTIHLPDLAVEQYHVRAVCAAGGRLRLQAAGTLGFTLDGRSTRDASLNPGEGAELVFGSYRLTVSNGADGAVAVEVCQPAERPGGKPDTLRGFALAGVLPGKRALSWTGLAAIVLVFLAVPIWSHLHRPVAKPTLDRPGAVMFDASWTPGALSSAHHALEDKCEACHVEPFVAVRDNACLACHQTIADHAAQPRQALARGFPHGFAALQGDVARAFHKPGPGACTDCHTEHEGAGRMEPTREKFCADCHGSMNTRLTGTALANAADFGTAHPQFQASVFTLPGQARPQRISLAQHPQQWDGLRFPHAMHLSATNGVARMAQRLGIPRGYGAPLACSDCHRKTADGVRFLPVDMEKDCESCHSLVYDRVGDTYRSLHHGNVAQMQADLIARDRSSRRPALTARRRPGLYAEGMIYAAQFSRPAFSPVAGAMDRGGLCGECHFPASSGGRLAVMPVTQPPRYLMQGWFDHEAHKQEKCASCHAAAQSNSAADLLLPGIAQCRTCHLGETATKAKVPSGCAMCHSYHPRIGPADAPRRIALR